MDLPLLVRSPEACISRGWTTKGRNPQLYPDLPHAWGRGSRPWAATCGSPGASAGSWMGSEATGTRVTVKTDTSPSQCPRMSLQAAQVKS